MGDNAFSARHKTWCSSFKSDFDDRKAKACSGPQNSLSQWREWITFGLGCEEGRMSKLLLIDDEADVQYSFQRIFDSPEIELTTASSGEEGLEADSQTQARPRDHGHPHGRHERARNAAPHPPDRSQAAGHPDDRLRHDADGHRGDEARRLRLPAQAVRRAEAQGDRRQRAQGRARHAAGGVLPAAARIGGLRTGHRRAAASRCSRSSSSSASSPPRTPPRSSRGESGTGKELVARAIYHHSNRSRAAVPGGQLRRHPRATARKRTVRPRARRVHRRDRCSASASSSNATAARSSWTKSAT